MELQIFLKTFVRAQIQTLARGSFWHFPKTERWSLKGLIPLSAVNFITPCCPPSSLGSQTIAIITCQSANPFNIITNDYNK